MIKTCPDCYSPIMDTIVRDNSFSARYGDTVAHHEAYDSEYICANGHGTDTYIEVEGELARRYIQRFGITDNIKQYFTICHEQ